MQVKDVQADEIWTLCSDPLSFKFAHEAQNQEIGDAYTFIALERHIRLILVWHLVKRTRVATEDFIATSAPLQQILDFRSQWMRSPHT